MFDPYGSDVLSTPPSHHAPARTESVRVPVEPGMVLEDVSTGFVGAVVRAEKSGGIHLVELEDRHGKRRSFPLGPGFWLEGKPIIAAPPTPQTKGKAPLRTNSGSRAPRQMRARVAKSSRLWVEGKHDAELIQHVWGTDLAEAGVAVELLDGADRLEEALAVFGPTETVRAGVLLDHLVKGSKEWRIAQLVSEQHGDGVLVLGHPYVDIWQAVKPARVGLKEWPHVPLGTDIKVGSLQALGWPSETQADIAMGWRRILASVRDYRDLEPALLGRVEELIDFVTEPGSQ